MIKILRYLKRYKLLVFFCVTFLLVQAYLDIYLPTLMSKMVNEGMMTQNLSLVYKYGGIMLIVSLLNGVIAVSTSLMRSVIGTRLSRDLRSDIFNKVESFSLNEFDKIGTSSLITRTTNDITQVQQVVVMGLRFLLYSPFLMIGGMIEATRTDAELAKILFIAVPLIAVCMIGLGKYAMPLFKSMQKKVDNINLVLSESLQGIRVIRAFNKLDTDRQKFDDANEDYTSTAIKTNKIMALMQPILMFIMNATTVFIVWYGGQGIVDGNLQVGEMMAFVQYAMMIMFSVVMLSMMFVMIPRAQASAERIIEVLETNVDIVDDENTIVDSGDLKGSIEFKNVSFFYPDAEEAVIENISFKSNASEVTAIIGSTGAGKSSIINLIPRFYDVTEGEILINGVDIRKMPIEHLRNKIGFVPQKAMLFTGTINDNIRFGKKDATEEEIINACKVAQADNFINETEKGYLTEIAQGGTNLSGGQKQRLSIARAIVKNPEIYIFDYSFSALDYKTDKLLREELKKITKDATTIVIAQRVTSIMEADRILVVNDGKIVGQGKHDELIKSCDVYKEIVESQLEEGEI